VTRYLSLEEVVIINATVIQQFGGIHGLRDRAALEAAVMRPQTGYHSDLFEEAAALFESLFQNHPFLDGNKRTAVTATAVFLALNGHELVFNDREMYEWLMRLLQTGRPNKTNLEVWLRQHARRT
jgi:death on curing protein